jgi:hypothetical protein
MQRENLETSPQNHQDSDRSALDYVDAASISLSHVRANCQENRNLAAEEACETAVVIVIFGMREGWGSSTLGWKSSPTQPGAHKILFFVCDAKQRSIFWPKTKQGFYKSRMETKAILNLI